ncbi:aminoacyltransferase [Bifidobacterium biavatii]|uniref:Peptidoglycan bridge formation protein FemAB n=1 Tax=Bifidobacterium biavatii DSM 23969 TaxID=1437608 RepID=A0A086ZT39_9BIFI|nr:aminoacyltransferase [Bifidobacterium biavatii]KFI49689.1 peptidoglycan bridge formation protein FemAB [Bifidobacterium biavatii DSM 23969]
MRSFTLATLTPDEFDAFSASHPQGNFQQTSAMGRLRAGQSVDVEYLAVKEHGDIVAAMLFETHRSRLSTFAAIHDGPLCDYHDRELVEFLVEQLKRHAKAKGAAQLEITPELPYRLRDSFGGELPADQGGAPDDETVDTLKANGFEHAGFTTGYVAVPRWRYVKDLSGFKDEKALLDSYAKNTRRNVKIARNSAVHVDKLRRDQLDVFHHICELSCEKQGFENRPLSYFEAIFDAFGDQAEFLVASIDMDEYLASWKRKRDGFLKDIDKLERSLETTKYPDTVNKKIATARSTYEASLKRVEKAHEYIEQDGSSVPVAAGLFVWHRRECVYLFSGSDEKYAKFYAPTAIQHHVMMQCLERGVDRYNFYGIDGIFDDPDDPGRGVLEFKQGFEGYVEEMPGEFNLPVMPVRYAVKQLAHKLLKR